MKLRDILGFIRFHSHFNYATVIASAILLGKMPLLELLPRLAIVYIGFNIILYGGLYALNDIADVSLDREDPAKRHRPIASGRVRLWQAWLYVAFSIVAGLSYAHAFLGYNIFLLFILFILANVLYSLGAKRWPYIEFAANALPHALRCILGMAIAGTPWMGGTVLAVFLLCTQFSVQRRMLEKRTGSSNRPTLKSYTMPALVALQALPFVLMLPILFVGLPVREFWFVVGIIVFSLPSLVIGFVPHRFQKPLYWLSGVPWRPEAPPSSEPMRISIIIPAFNEESYIRTCLESIFRKRHPELLEVIVVDNASTDGTAQIAKSFPQVRVIYEPQKGLPYARQRGLTEMRGNFYASLDADTQLPDSWFDVIREKFKRDPTLICLSGPYDYYDLSYVRRRFIWYSWKVLYRLSSLLGTQVVGGNFVAKKEALMTMGGFDTSIDFYGEDASTARRLRDIGKIKFSFRFFVYSSGRRFASRGLLLMGWIYCVNFLSIFLTKKAVTQNSEDIR